MSIDPIRQLTETVNQEMADWLVEKNWVDTDTMDMGVKQFKQHLQDKDLRQGSILKILCWEMSAFDEWDFINNQIHMEGLGFCDLNHYKKDTDIFSEFSLSECWATLSLPFDFYANTFFVASCYYLSESTRKHWENRLRRRIIWYGCDLSTLTINLEQTSVPNKVATKIEEEN